MRIANKSFLEREKLKKYAAKERRNTMAAAPTTTKRFGPSGSLKNRNITLEKTSDVIARIRSEIFSDLKCIFKLYQKLRAAGLGLEPRYSPPKGDVLPLDDPAMLGIISSKFEIKKSCANLNIGESS